MKNLYKPCMLVLVAMITLLPNCVQRELPVFRVAHLCDPQLGFFTQKEGIDCSFENDVARLEQAVRKVNELAPDVVVVAGDMVQDANNDLQVATFSKIIAQVKAPVILTPGNHDLPNPVTEEGLQRYRSCFGEDFRVVECKGRCIISANTQLWRKAPTEDSLRHDRLLRDALKKAKQKKQPVIMLTHVPPFALSIDEDDDYFNLPKAIRKNILGLCGENGVILWLAGHTHNTARRSYEEITILNGETTSVNFDERPFGFRLLTLRHDNSFDWEFIALNEQKELAFLFKSGDDEYNTFRIPAMAVTNKGAILAFAEGRKNTSSDTGDIDLVLKRSTDGGKTWNNLRVVWDDGENVCGNPAPVVDRKTGDIFLLMTRNLGADCERQIIDQTSEDTRRIFVTQSTDDGVTWTKPVEITKDVKKDNWTWYATGPCQGIQIVHGRYKGRLVIPCDHIEAVSKKYFSHVIYSDDHGKTWKLGGTSPDDQVNECTVAEITDGKLLLNMRNYDRTQKNRKTAVSHDGGMTWTDFKSDEVLIEPICQASLHRYSFGRKEKNRLLFTNPANPDKRCNMTLRLSYDDGVSWAKSKVLFSGHAAYSEVVKLPDGGIGCFYEAGYEHPYEGIVFEKIKLAELEK